jgi:hypothetical protein
LALSFESFFVVSVFSVVKNAFLPGANYSPSSSMLSNAMRYKQTVRRLAKIHSPRIVIHRLVEFHSSWQRMERIITSAPRQAIVASSVTVQVPPVSAPRSRHQATASASGSYPDGVATQTFAPSCAPANMNERATLLPSPA